MCASIWKVLKIQRKCELFADKCLYKTLTPYKSAILCTAKTGSAKNVPK